MAGAFVGVARTIYVRKNSRSKSQLLDRPAIRTQLSRTASGQQRIRQCRGATRSTPIPGRRGDANNATFPLPAAAPSWRIAPDLESGSCGSLELLSGRLVG